MSPVTGENKQLALVHLASGIGNIVLATPLLVALQEMGFVVDLLLHADYPQTADLLRNWSTIREIYQDSPQPISTPSYARIVPAIPPFYWSRFVDLYRREVRTVRRPPDSLFYQDEQEYYLAFARALGYPPSRRPIYRLPIAASPESGATGDTLVIAPGCKTGVMAAKRWPYYPELAVRFRDVVLVGTLGDVRRDDGTVMTFPEHVRSFVDELTLRETAELMATAGAVVGNDSGLCHVAGAVGTPTLMLFGPTPHLALGQLPTNVKILRSQLPCEPCWFTSRLKACCKRIDCLKALNVAMVEQELRVMLGAAGPVPALGHEKLEPRASERTTMFSSTRQSAASCELSKPTMQPEWKEVCRAAGDALASLGGTAALELPLVTCIMPTADRRAFVPQAIRYFRRQDYLNRELIVLDDGADPVSDLIPPDSRIRYIRLQSKCSVGSKRNLACGLAMGKIIVHWDDDDWIASWRLTYQVGSLLERPDRDICGLARLLFYSPQANQAWEYVYPRTQPAWLAGGSLCYRKRLWEGRQFPDLNEGEDTRFVWTLNQAGLVALSDNRFYVALVHPGNSSRKRTGEACWRPRPSRAIEELMGPDWPLYHTGS